MMRGGGWVRLVRSRLFFLFILFICESLDHWFSLDLFEERIEVERSIASSLIYILNFPFVFIF